MSCTREEDRRQKERLVALRKDEKWEAVFDAIERASDTLPDRRGYADLLAEIDSLRAQVAELEHNLDLHIRAEARAVLRLAKPQQVIDELERVRGEE